MFNSLRKLFTAYLQTEEQFAQLRYVATKDSLLIIERFIKTFPKKHRINVSKYSCELAILGYTKNEIINKMKLEPLKYNINNDKFDKVIKILRKKLQIEIINKRGK